eukprot:CAMPEP_0206142090 /NCGR_PEP_ID=MMETSP1473-20131121/15519_1 /ASSEMBLY_ACC=CAM_ASM_001109 /TAXON_ID=1461547 /ORGANISM="Stichococcus sp, Strain RCC1054" /LENGTH=44 /DNA_ID= /DNA_START= /DNA_END= /DNA_ORIENTATION=
MPPQRRGASEDTGRQWNVAAAQSSDGIDANIGEMDGGPALSFNV